MAVILEKGDDGKPKAVELSNQTTIPARAGKFGLFPKSVMTCWEPSEDDIARILVGQPVYIIVLGDYFPGMAVTTDAKKVKQLCKDD